jgi:hypothetical protein
MKTMYIFLKIIVITIFITSICLYINERIIIKENKKISSKIAEKHCWHGSRGGSSILIDYKGNKYYVSIKRKNCDEINVGDMIDVYYNEQFDYFFLKEHINFRIIGFFGFLTVFVFCFKYLPNRSNITNRN